MTNTTKMNSINNLTTGLELAQIGWVVPDIHTAVKFLGVTREGWKVLEQMMKTK